MHPMAHHTSSRRPKRRLGAALLAAILAVGAGAPLQAASIQQATAAGGAPPHGKANGLTVGHVHIFPARPRRGGKLAAGPADSSTDNLQYGGGSVQHDPTFYAIFWLPSGNNYEPGIVNGDSGYENLMERYLQDAGSTNLANVVSQYYDSTGNITPTTQYGGAWVDTNAYPHGGSTSDPLLDSDIQGAVNDALAANPSWQDGINSTFFVFTARGIESCTDSSHYSCSPGITSSLGYCGYHSEFSVNGHTRVYANMPEDEYWDVSNGLNSSGLEACYSTSALPNGDIFADDEFSVLSHEQWEAETDPYTIGGWRDSSGNEIGDKCVGQYGNEPFFGPSNHDVGGHLYYLQEEWSNADNGCGGSVNPSGGYFYVWGPYAATDAGSTGELTLAQTTQPPSINVALTPNPTIN